MTAHRNVRMLTRYSAWANDRLYAALSEFAPSLLREARAGRPNGLAGVLTHAYVVDLIWKGHLEGKQHGFTSRNLEQLPAFEELRTAQAEVDEWYVGYADEQSDASLDEVVNFQFVDGGFGSQSRGDILLHIVNHKTYHRGYVADMLYELGSRPPTIDLPVFLRDAPPRL